MHAKYEVSISYDSKFLAKVIFFLDTKPKCVCETLMPRQQQSPKLLFYLLYLQGSMNVHVVLYCWCHSDSASFLLYFTFLSHLFPLPCGAGSTVPREGFDSIVIMPFFLVCCGCDTSYIVSVHIQCQAPYIHFRCVAGINWRVRLAKQETLTPPGTWSHLWFAGVHECPPWCSIVGATVTVHHFFCILHFCHTCSLCRVELVVQFPARGSTQVLLCLFFLVCCGCDTSYIVSVHIQCQASIYTLSLCRGHSWRVRLAKQETLTPPGHLVSPLVCRGP